MSQTDRKGATNPQQQRGQRRVGASDHGGHPMVPPWRVSVFYAQHLGGWVLDTLLHISVPTTSYCCGRLSIRKPLTIWTENFLLVTSTQWQTESITSCMCQLCICGTVLAHTWFPGVIINLWLILPPSLCVPVEMLHDLVLCTKDFNHLPH